MGDFFIFCDYLSTEFSINLEKIYFELGFGGEGQDTSRHFEGGFVSVCSILPIEA